MRNHLVVVQEPETKRKIQNQKRGGKKARVRESQVLKFHYHLEFTLGAKKSHAWG